MGMTTHSEWCQTLAARLNFGGDQADFVYARGMRYVDDVGHVGKWDVVIALHEHDLLGTRFENIFEAALQSLPCRFVGIDLESGRIAGAMIDQLHDDGAVGSRRRLFLILRRRLGHQRIQALRRQGRDHHENDQQHQQHVDQRRDVHIRVLAPFGADCHSHIDLLYRYYDYRSLASLLADYWPPVGAGGATGGGAKEPDF